MERAMHAAIVGGVPLVRAGLALQLRLRGVEVAAEVPTIKSLQTTTLTGVVMLADPRREPELTNLLLGRGLLVIALHDTAQRPAHALLASSRAGARTASVRPAPVRRTLAPQAVPGPGGRGRLVLLPLHELPDVDVVIDLLRGERPTRKTRASLTPTERSVHALLGQGYSNAGIADALSLSPKTVEGCVSTLFVKLGLSRDDPGRNRRVAAALSWVAAS